MASPTRLIRRSIRNTPIGAPPSAQREHAGQRAAHELEFGEGRDQRVVEHDQAARDGMASTTQAAAPVVEGLAHPPRHQRDFPASAPPRSRPRPPARAPAAAFPGNGRAPGPCRAAPPAPCAPRRASACTSSSRSAEVLASMALNGSSSTMMRASCSSSRANSMRCICPPDSVPIGRVSKPVRPTAASACSIVSRSALPDAAEQAGRAPQTHADEIEHRDRKAAVDVGDLRQVGDVAGVEAAERDRARERLQHADDAAKQRRLAGAVRADHREQRAGGDLAVEMMHGRMAVIAQRHIRGISARAMLTSSPARRRPTAPR